MFSFAKPAAALSFAKPAAGGLSTSAAGRLSPSATEGRSAAPAGGLSAIRAEAPVWLLFGLSGSGKSYVGDVISRAWGWSLYHADDDITSAMQEALAQAQPFTDVMRDEFFAQLVARIESRRDCDTGRPLVVTQGVYKRRHREWLQQQVPGLVPVWVTAPPELISARLSQRADGVQPASAAALVNDFEPPCDTTLCIVNDGDEQRIIDQFEACLSAIDT